jgi:RNA-directed DNA polymerase
VRSDVNRLQTRIVKATQERQRNLVKRVSYLLTHSHVAKLLAVRIVMQNKSKRTPGVDGELWMTASDKMRTALCPTNRQYKTQPLRRILKNIAQKNQSEVVKCLRGACGDEQKFRGLAYDLNG